MKKKFLCLGIVAILITMLVLLTGCGENTNSDQGSANNEDNSLIETLNNISDNIVSDWKNKGYHYDIAVSIIQNKLNDYTIIASGDSEFKNKIDTTEYVNKPENYDGNSFHATYVMKSSENVNYFLVLDKNKNKYYNVQIKYETMKLDDKYEYDYPVFSNAKELK